jgi:hypothetical protein
MCLLKYAASEATGWGSSQWLVGDSPLRNVGLDFEPLLAASADAEPDIAQIDSYTI